MFEQRADCCCRHHKLRVLIGGWWRKEKRPPPQHIFRDYEDIPLESRVFLEKCAHLPAALTLSLSFI